MLRVESIPMASGAAAQPAPASGGTELRDVVNAGTRDFDAVRADVLALPPFQHLAAVMPGPDLAFGGGMLLVIMLVHAAGVRGVTNHVASRQERIAARPTAWRADVLMSGAVLMLLVLHVVEILIWSTALVYAGLVPDWRVAGLFAGSTYTTIGYNDILPRGWGMLSPLIAISGLFSFGWSGSVLVDVVARCHRIKDLAAAAAKARARVIAEDRRTAAGVTAAIRRRRPAPTADLDAGSARLPGRPRATPAWDNRRWVRPTRRWRPPRRSPSSAAARPVRPVPRRPRRVAVRRM